MYPVENEHFKPKKEPVQRPKDRNTLGKYQEEQKHWCGWYGVRACDLSTQKEEYTGKQRIRSQDELYSRTSSLKTKGQRDSSVAEGLPSMDKGLGSLTSTSQKSKNKNK